MNNLTKLTQRKAELKAQIDQQLIELKSTFLEVREEIEPTFLLKKAIQGLFRPPKEKGANASNSFFERFPLPISFLIDLFVKNSSFAALLKTVAPAALKTIPNLIKKYTGTEPDEPGTSTSTKAKVYGSLKKAVHSLRNQMKQSDQTPVTTPEPSEN